MRGHQIYDEGHIDDEGHLYYISENVCLCVCLCVCVCKY